MIRFRNEDERRKWAAGGRLGFEFEHRSWISTDEASDIAEAAGYLAPGRNTLHCWKKWGWIEKVGDGYAATDDLRNYRGSWYPYTRVNE